MAKTKDKKKDGRRANPIGLKNLIPNKPVGDWGEKIGGYRFSFKMPISLEKKLLEMDSKKRLLLIRKAVASALKEEK
jgi:hypothetical protein